ncbi:uncharacterized protein LOC130893232 isoform X1 [Diorhabda carinulata]|uniref:uncharacterized protein LOC130893232 isoform X1 n=2 Tax=Diorhabda carinulata TaxID=1163345 RepID=UPI0025A24706|nr:uncharacterized protein LOC130893232 isoform X1 [Diorhabda carinulata]
MTDQKLLMAEDKRLTTSSTSNVTCCSNSDKNNAVSSETQSEKSKLEKNNGVNGLNHVCRTIDFGDSSSIDDMFASYDETQRQQQREKWNFDFANEVPLEGDWEWERVPAESPKAQVVVSSLKKNRESRNV